jgi:hypothetical protein
MRQSTRERKVIASRRNVYFWKSHKIDYVYDGLYKYTYIFEFTMVSLLDIKDVSDLDMGDFLRPQESSFNTNEEKKETHQKHIDDPVNYRDIDEFVCQNTLCKFTDKRELIDKLHTYEINGDTRVVICGPCYDKGFRFCLFTHEVCHISTMECVLDEWYVQPKYNNSQLSEKMILQVNDLDSYLRMIGIENPNPTYEVINI